MFFGEGEKIGCVDIPVVDDGDPEGPERFELEIMPPDNGGVPFEPGSKPMAQITIRDGEYLRKYFILHIINVHMHVQVYA